MKPRVSKIAHEKGGHYTIFEAPDFEYVNPIEYYAESHKQTCFTIMRDMLLAKKLPFPIQDIDRIIQKKAEQEWEEKYNEIIQTEVPQNFIDLLTADSKNEQVKLLKGQSLTPDQLIAFIFKAWTDFGFSFSQYKAEYAQKGLDKGDMPQVVEVKDDKVEKVGSTSLSDGQLKQAVEHRKVIISKFLDNGASWHCLFVTFKSLKGGENWKDGQPHYHYISDKFGHERDKVVAELTNEKYKLGNLPHIDLLDYR